MSGPATGGFLSPLFGGTGALGQAANQTWQYGQYMPYNLSLPGANLNLQNNQISGQFSGGLGNMYSGMGNFGNSLFSNGSLNYNPQAGSFLGGQYNSIYGNNPATAASINGAANGQFQNLMQAEQPWLQMQNAQNLDSEMAKGTIASTAGQYQTAGLAQAQNSLMSQNANTAYQQALQQAGLQQSEQASSFGAASNVANLQEQEAQFAPQLATGQANSTFQNLLSGNNALAQEAGLGANVGGMQSSANTNALQNNFLAGRAGLQGQSGFLNNLLFGGGSQNGGLIGSILNSGQGTSGSGLGGLATKGANSIYNYLFGGGNLSAADTAGLASGAADYANQADTAASDLFSGADSSLTSNVGDYLSNFSGAGGQAATQAAGYLGSSGALGATSLAADSAPAMAGISAPTTGIGEDALNANLSSGASSYLPYLGAAMSLYNMGSNWQSGNTASDTEQGAETGAEIGSIIPGVGTVIGGVVGAAAGALSSAFGGGEKDPETSGFNNMVAANAKTGNNGIVSQLNPAQAYQSLAGMMDAKNNTPGHSTPLEEVFGREGEGNFMSQMSNTVNQAITSGKIDKNASPQQIYSQIVQPWLQSKNAYVPANAIISSNGTKNNGTVDSLITQLIGQWQSGSLNANSKVGIQGQTIQGLASYGA